MPRIVLISRSKLLARSTLITGLCALVFAVACSGARKHVNLGSSRVSWNDSSADVYVVDTRTSRIDIVGRNASGTKIGSFESLRDHFYLAGIKLAFATNGGMFHADYGPVGLLVQNGVEQSPINLEAGEGNFFLKPNGAFLIYRDGKAAIVRSEKYLQLRRCVRAATQSGPLLLIDGQVNPAFNAGSTNRLIRSGVGVIDPHTVVFAVSSRPVNFWDFSLLFRDALKCKNALYLDGVISKFYVPGKTESARGEEFGVLIGVTKIP